MQLVFKYPIKVTSNKNVRKLKWISNCKEYFKEFFKNRTLKLISKDCYNKFNIMKISQRGDKTWPIKKPNMNKIERDQHTRICNAIKMNKIISYSIIEKSKDNIIANNNTTFFIYSNFFIWRTTPRLGQLEDKPKVIQTLPNLQCKIRIISHFYYCWYQIGSNFVKTNYFLSKLVIL